MAENKRKKGQQYFRLGFNINEEVSYIIRLIVLIPGDVIFTATPFSEGMGLKI